jgi:hypothetical protein
VINKELTMQVQVKDTIRAYDFKPMLGRTDCFVEGVVLDRADTSRGYQAYRIRVTRDVFDGREFTEVGYKSQGNRVGEIVFVPWRVSFSEFQGRVINLSR